ncbi:hypothetical protein RSW97_26580, partial [Escherichia coli]|nr:hypothetical protein [Escherichia coli]
NMYAEPSRFQDRTQKCNGRTLAVGAGNMNHRRQAALRMAKPAKKAPHAVEREIDPLGMEREQARKDDINCNHSESHSPAN